MGKLFDDLKEGDIVLNKTPLDYEKLCIRNSPWFKKSYPTYPIYLKWAEESEKIMNELAGYFSSPAYARRRREIEEYRKHNHVLAFYDHKGKRIGEKRFTSREKLIQWIKKQEVKK